MNTSVHSSPEIRAVICDIYGTLLKVLPPQHGAAERWRTGIESLLPFGHALNLQEFNERCRALTAEHHRRMKAGGEPFPEVDWLEIVASVFPALRVVNKNPESGDPATWISERARLISQLHAHCSRTCVAMPGALNALEQFQSGGLLLGIASNAQDYTRAEVTEGGFRLGQFAKDLTFLSCGHGFAKPSPRVFAHLTAALAARGIFPAQTLMVGDREDNDIAPAAAAGWRTWLITQAEGDGRSGGDWGQLAHAVLNFAIRSASGD